MSEVINKWRETIIDPYKIKFNKLSIKRIVSYPPAGNDVLECIDNNDNNFILKIERSKKANFKNEVKVLNLIAGKLNVPKVLETGIVDNINYIALSKLDGDKISTLIKNNNGVSSDYLYNYGKCLAYIHSLDIKTNIAQKRVINYIPTVDEYNIIDKYELSIIDCLNKNIIKEDNNTFIHGDFHYGNVLFKENYVSGIIDFEYSGLGFKEQDIAWALILRPTQSFMKTIDEIDIFLKGYKELGNYDKEKLNWCLLNGYFHFYLMNKNSNNKEYINNLLYFINLHLLNLGI